MRRNRSDRFVLKPLPIFSTFSSDTLRTPRSTPAVVGPMQPASLRSLFLVNALLFPYAADGAAESDADVEGHCTPSWRDAADAYTADESHLC